MWSQLLVIFVEPVNDFIYLFIVEPFLPYSIFKMCLFFWILLNFDNLKKRKSKWEKSEQIISELTLYFV